MAFFKRVTHVIFDLDGLIFDTEDIYTEVHQIIANKYKKILTWEAKMKCMGKVANESAVTVIQELGLPITVAEFQATFDALCKERFLKTRPKLLPGVKRLIKHLHVNKVPIAIATTSKRETFDIETRNHQALIGLFHHAACVSSHPEVSSSISSKDVFLACADEFEDKPAPEKVLVFEDAPNGVEAALEAGIKVVIVPDPRVEPEGFKRATQVLNSIKDFDPELFGLPPFPK